MGDEAKLEKFRDLHLQIKLAAAAGELAQAAAYAGMGHNALHWIDGDLGVAQCIKHARKLIAEYEAGVAAILSSEATQSASLITGTDFSNFNDGSGMGVLAPPSQYAPLSIAAMERPFLALAPEDPAA